jgi:phi LC3 family holin
VFGLLTALGLVVDFTTEGVNDSNRAMSYEEPWDDSKH